jgi:SAM-dependent methyltransferase
VADRNRCTSTRAFDYRGCGSCGLIWMLGVPDDLAELYPDDYHASIAPADLAAAVAAEAPRVGLISRHVAPGQLVELGPSQGVFAAAAKAAGFDVIGLEMDADCCVALERDVGVRAINTVTPEAVLPALAPSRAVVMWHVIEHLRDPWEVLRAIAAHLEPGGVLAIAAPNPHALQFALFGKRWVHVDTPRHLWLIPLPALREDLAALGFEQLTATTVDPTGLLLNGLGWQRSLLRPPTLRPDPRGAWTMGKVFGGLFGAIERRGLRGAAYTAVFRKGGDGLPA